MQYAKDHRNESPYISVNTLIQPQKHTGIGAFPPYVTEKQIAQVSATGAPLSATPPKNTFSNLTISQPGDSAELEADRVAAEVTNNTEIDLPAKQKDQLRIHAKRSGGKEMTSDLPNDIHNLSSGQPLGEGERNFFEPRFGVDFSQVRVHTGERASGMAEAINAKAFTAGNNIVFAPGEYQPGTGAGQNLMAHELTHVVQQSQSDGNVVNRQADSGKDEPGFLDQVFSKGLGGVAWVVEKVPTYNFVPVPGFEFMQNFIKGMMIGSLERVSKEKVENLWLITQNVAKAVTSFDYMKAYFFGFLKGFFGDFIMIWELPGTIKSITKFVENLIASIQALSKEDLQGFAARIDDIKAHIMEGGAEAINNILADIKAGKASELIIETLKNITNLSLDAGKNVGSQLTDQMINYFSTTDSKKLSTDLGGLFGEVSGTIAFTALLAVLTEGAGSIWAGVRAGIKTVTEIIGEGVGKAIRAIGTVLKKLSSVCGRFIEGVRAFIKGFGQGSSKLFKGIKGKLDEVLEKVKGLIDDILEKLGRRNVIETGKNLIPGSPEHKLQRWLDYQSRYPERFPTVTDKIDPKWSKQYDTIIENGRFGRGFESEALSTLKYEKNNLVFMNEEGIGFIPDSIKGNPTIIEWGKPYDFVEVKGWQDLSNTGNLKAMLDYVEKYGGSIEAVLRSAKHPSGMTNLSKPLQQRLDRLFYAGKAKIIRIP